MAQYYEYAPRPSLIDDHTYIFPSPQAQFDDQNLFILSPISLSDPRSRESSQSPFDSPLILADTDIDWDSAVEDSPPSRWEVILRRRRSEAHLHSQPQPCPSQDIAQPHPRMHIPLLTYLASLFAIDDATLRLITHTPDKLILFPVSIPHTPADVDQHVRRGRDHLFSLPSSNPETRVIRAGFAAFADQDIPPSAFVTAPFAGLLGIVSSFVTSKSKVLRDALCYGVALPPSERTTPRNAGL